MPRTKQPKMTKKMKKDMNSSDSSILSTSGTTYRSRKEILNALAEERANVLRDYDALVEKDLKEMDIEFKKKMISCPHKDLLKTTKLKDLVEIAKQAEENPEFAAQLEACLNGTYVVVPELVLPDHSKIGSSIKSGAASTISSDSRRPPSSASSIRSGHSSRLAAPLAHPGSANRSRSAVKTNLLHPSSGMRRRSMSQPQSARRNHQAPPHNYHATPIITPKVNPEQSTSVLRLPKTGENLYSVGGSPVMPNALAVSSKAPQALIPLRDGKMLSILPRDPRSVNTCPMEFSPNTRRNLMLLKQNLDCLMGE